MANAPHAGLDQYLQRAIGGNNFSVSGTTITLTSPTLTHQQLHQLIDAVQVAGHKVVITAGAFTIKPR